LTGASLLVAEAHVPSYGVLGITGAALLATGAVLGVGAAGGSVLLVAMQRAMALGAEAERERRAKIIHAEGEYQASQRLRDAADVIAGNPASLQLRYLQTLTEIGATQNSTIVFPLPLDVVKPFLDATTALQPPEQEHVQKAHDNGDRLPPVPADATRP
jgi:hypothetical protein